jgi:nucleotide-binding universal stress UspA family protein
MKTILATVDFSSCTSSIISEAAALARAFNGRLILLHVIDHLPATSSEFGFAEAAARMRSAATSESRRELDKLQRQLGRQGTTALTHHVVGEPGSAILEQAHAFGADYVVVGSRGHGPFYELLIGGTAQRVIKESPCPVVIASGTCATSRSRPRTAAKRIEIATPNRIAASEIAEPARRTEFRAAPHQTSLR